MGDKFPKPGEDKYCEFVEAWKTAHLKCIGEIENPPRQDWYREWYEQLDDYTDNKIVRLEHGCGVRRCTCKTKSVKHASDCRIHPHRMVIFHDDKGREFAVESLFLEPTSFDEELLAMIMETDASPTLDAVEQIETLEDINQIEEPSENQEILQSSFVVEKNYALVTVSRDGIILCEDACLSKNSEFIFNKDSGEWLYGDFSAKIGDIIFFEEKTEISVAVIEADFEQLQFFVLSLKILLQKIIKKEIAAKILED